MLVSHDRIKEIYRYNIKRKQIASIILVAIVTSLALISGLQDQNNDPIIDEKEIKLPYYGNVTDFTLTNSNNLNYTLSEDNDRIKVVNFFYTKCPGDEGCSLITLKLSLLFAKIRQNDYLNQIRLVSIDFDYINDTIADLAPYAKLYTEDTVNWQFLIGNKTQIDKITEEWGYYFEVNNQTSSINLNHGGEEHTTDPYSHSFVIYIIDKQLNIRKFLLGSGWDLDSAFESLEYLINEMTSQP